MKFLLTLLLLLFTSLAAPAAITDRYVNNAGSGTADGSSAANAMSLTTFVDYMVTGGSFTAAAGDRFNIKVDGTYARTTNVDTWVNGGTTTSPVIVRGYNTTPGDGYLGRSSGGTLITTNMPTFTYTGGGKLVINGNAIIFESINITTASTAGSIESGGDDCVILRSVIGNTGTAANSNALAPRNRWVIMDNDISFSGASSGLAAIRIPGAHTIRMVGNRINGGAQAGIVVQSAAALTCVANTFFGSTGVHVSVGSTTATINIINNTFVGGGSDAIQFISGHTGFPLIFGNMVTDNAGWAFDSLSANGVCYAYNRTRDNTSGVFAAGTDWETATAWGHVTTDTGNASTDYTNAGSNDYSLIQDSPATSANIPASASIGALQRLQTGGGGGSTETSATFIE